MESQFSPVKCKRYVHIECSSFIPNSYTIGCISVNHQNEFDLHQTHFDDLLKCVALLAGANENASEQTESFLHRISTIRLLNIFRFLSTMSFEKLKHYCVSQGSVIFPEFGKLFVNVL